MGRVTTAALRFSLLGLVAATTACAGVSPTPSVRERFLAALDSLGYDTTQAAGPRVAISAESEPFHTRRITPRIHAADDAYVAVVNVWPSGEVSVVWPTSPEDDGFVAGGRTYAVPSMFSGFATVFPPTGAQGLRFVRYNRSSDARISARGPGYVVLIASRAPLDLAALDTAGYFDDVRFGNDLRAMEPSAIIPRLAVLAGGGSTALTLDHARYGGYDITTLASSSSSWLASRSSGSCGLGYYGNPAIYAWDAEFGAAGCGFGGYDQLVMRRWLLSRPPVVRPDTARPPADSTDTPEAQRGALRAGRAAIVEPAAVYRALREPVADDVVDLDASPERRRPGYAERQRTRERANLDEVQRQRRRLDDAEQRRSGERPDLDEVRRERRPPGRTRDAERVESEPRRVAPPAPRREAERPAPSTRAEPASPRVEPAPRQAEGRPQGGESERQP